MHIFVSSGICPAAQLDALLEAFADREFASYATSSRLDGDHDVSLYVETPEPAPELLAICVAHKLALTAQGGGTAEELVKGYLPEDPIEIAPDVWIDPRGDLPTAGRLVLHLPATLAFGDGHHPSTRMAAGLLCQLPLKDRRVLDLGCGTGALGLLCLLKGAATAEFTDIDPASLAATSNALAAHGVSGDVHHADLLDGIHAPCDLFIANLYADLVLVILSDPRLDQLWPVGDMVLSGIHVRHRDAVKAALVAAGCTLTGEREEAWWCALAAARPPRG